MISSARRSRTFPLSLSLHAAHLLGKLWCSSLKLSPPIYAQNSPIKLDFVSLPLDRSYSSSLVPKGLRLPDQYYRPISELRYLITTILNEPTLVEVPAPIVIVGDIYEEVRIVVPMHDIFR